MAKIQTNVSESVFYVKRWRGVNEAEEGEAALRNGEGAVCKNFRVTSGGALKKRNGSKNVAGLMSAYNASVDRTNPVIANTSFGINSFTMYPRFSVDSVGNIAGEGTAVEVFADDTEDYGGYVFRIGVDAYELIEATVEETASGENVRGGGVELGALTAFATGSDTTLSGSLVESGTSSISVYPGALIYAPNDVRVDGTAQTKAHSTKTSTGFDTTDVGGYLYSGGTLYKYYGAKTEKYTTYRLRKRYAATRYQNGTRTYYKTTSWSYIGEVTIEEGDSLTGTTSYSFDDSTGTFSAGETPKTLYAGQSGEAYFSYGSFVNRLIATASGSESKAKVYRKYPDGPYTEPTYDYTIGDYIDSSWNYTGYTDVRNKTVDGVRYTIAHDGTSYYAFCYDTEDTSERYARDHAFYGYPVTSLYYDLVKWYAYPVITMPNASTDKEVKALWSGMVSGREVIVAACNGNLWELTLTNGEWSKATCGTIDTSGTVSIFGFDGKAYILTDTEYKVWNGTIMADVAGYRPLISVTNPPAGGGTLLEEVNKLTGARRAWYSPDGTAATFRLPETGLTSIDWVKSTVTGEAITNWKYDLEAGTVTFGAYSTGHDPRWTDEPPAAGTDTIEIAWTYPTNYRSEVIGMKYAEIFNGAQDTRLFLYGDGSNKAIYSGLDYDGLGRADYFPDLNEAAVGDENTPITAMIRHYDRLLCFKLDSTWSISYSTITLADGSTTAGYYVVPVNRDVGSCAYGEARLVENRPRTLDGRSVIEWKPSSGGYLTADQRNAERVSKRVDTSIRGFDLSSARTFYDKINHEYYVIGSNGTALVNNVDADAWYIYTGFDARCMIVYQDEVYYGDGDGYLRHFSADYYSDNGEAIDCLWESGAMDFSQDFRRKYSAMIWVGIKPEENGYLEASAETDRKTDFADYEVERDDAGAVPEMTRLKIKAKKFTYYKLIFKNETADTTATVVSADIRVRSTGYVR